jgi:hypothetical protein
MRKFFTALTVTIGLLLTSVPAHAQVAPANPECITVEELKLNLLPGVEVKEDWTGPEVRTVRQVIALEAGVSVDDVTAFDRLVLLEAPSTDVYGAFAFNAGCHVEALFGVGVTQVDYFKLKTALRTANGA